MKPGVSAEHAHQAVGEKTAAANQQAAAEAAEAGGQGDTGLFGYGGDTTVGVDLSAGGDHQFGELSGDFPEIDNSGRRDPGCADPDHIRFQLLKLMAVENFGFDFVEAAALQQLLHALQFAVIGGHQELTNLFAGNAVFVAKFFGILVSFPAKSGL